MVIFLNLLGFPCFVTTIVLTPPQLFLSNWEYKGDLRASRASWHFNLKKPGSGQHTLLSPKFFRSQKGLNTVSIAVLQTHPLIHWLIYSMSICWTHLKSQEVGGILFRNTVFSSCSSAPSSSFRFKNKCYFHCVCGRLISNDSENFMVRISFVFVFSPISWYGI